MMNWKYIKWSISLLLLAIIFSGCFQSDYTKLVKSELAKGIRKDSVLLGINFGDTRQEFFGKCFDLNKQHLVTQGSKGLAVQYLFKDSLFHSEPTDIKLLFSPFFDEKEVIAGMDLEFSYLAWAPWNRHLQSDSLELKASNILMHWYGGNKFITAKVGDKNVPVKLDGNRRIMISRPDTQTVVVSIQDILHPKFKHSGY
jgi:hypothetical protein